MGNGKGESLEAAIEKQDEQIKKTILGDGGNDEEYQDALDYVYGLVEEDIKDEYLVSGAILTCEKATGKEIIIDGIPFLGGCGNRTKLVVNRKEKIIDKAKATILDCKKEINIFPFGNCLAELSNQVKENLKNNRQAQINGTCKYLMWLEERWEHVLEGKNGFFFYEGVQELTMQSVLFCKRGGAFIYPLTSGQRITKYDYELLVNQLTKEDTLLIYKYQLSLGEYKIGQELGLKENQLVIFKEIREYFEDIPSLRQENVIFTFEGLGNKNGVTNDLHPNGQFNALFVIYKDGQLIYAMGEGSTLPDRTNNATTRDGVYKAIFINHKGHYAALQLNLDCDLEIREGSELKERMSSNMKLMGLDIEEEKNVLKDVPAYRFVERSSMELPNSADGVNMHMAKDLYPGSGWSTSCITVAASEYYEFGVMAGFIESQNNAGNYATYESIYDKIKTPYAYQSWGYVVINREYMNPEERKVFLPDYETQMEKN